MTLTTASTLHFDVLIVGSGLAGLSAALLLAPTQRVAVITKRAVHEGSSGWAQGAIQSSPSTSTATDGHPTTLRHELSARVPAPGHKDHSGSAPLQHEPRAVVESRMEH